MKKSVFVVGLLFLLVGAIYAQPADDIRDHIDRIEHEEIHDNLLDGYNSSHEQMEDQLNDNLDVASYGVAMLGLLLIILSIVKRKEKGSGLLYQKGDKQNISPKDLEKIITHPSFSTNSQAPPTFPPPPFPMDASSAPAPIQGSPPSYDAFELPAMRGSGAMPINKAQNTPSHDTVPSDPTKEYSLFCPNCGQGFSVKGAIKTVICPRCGKRFDTDRARKG